MHGGLSPNLRSLDQLRRIARPCDVQETGKLKKNYYLQLLYFCNHKNIREIRYYSGLLCDILWSDPDPSVVGYAPNERGVSYVFGVDVLGQFLQKHDLDIVVRGHQVSCYSIYSHLLKTTRILFTPKFDYLLAIQRNSTR